MDASGVAIGDAAAGERSAAATHSAATAVLIARARGIARVTLTGRVLSQMFDPWWRVGAELQPCTDTLPMRSVMSEMDG